VTLLTILLTAALGFQLNFLMNNEKESGADGRDRTDDLRFTKPLLYQLSYIGLKSSAAIMPCRTAPSNYSRFANDLC
jgi:hypothetical protein